MRQASSCPLCLFTIDEQPLDERLVANDSSDQNRNTSWAMGSHVADHLHHLMIISLQIMSAMQVSHNEDQDQRQGHPQSQSSGPSTAFSALDDGEMRKRLNDLPDSISGSMNMSESYQETAWISVMQEKSLSMADNMASLALTYISQDLWTQAEVLEEQVTEARKEVLGSEHPDTLVSINQLGVIFASQGKNEDAKSMYQQALQGRIKVLGAEHPNTLASMTSLAAIYKDLGQWEEAEKLERLRLASHTSIGPERDGHSPPSGTNTRVPLTDATQGRRKRRYSGSLKVIQRPLSSDSEIWNISDLSNDFLAESLRWHPTERDIESLASPHHYNVVADVSYSIPLIFGFGPAIKVSVHPLRIRDLPFLCHNHVIYEWPPSSAPPQTYSHLVLPATMSQDSMTNLPTDLDNHLSLLVKSHFRSFPLYCSPITVLREVYVLYLSLPQNTHEHLLEQALKLLTLVHLSGDITIPSPSTNSVLDELIGSTMTLEEPLATTPCFIRAQFGTIAQTLALSLMKEVLLSLEELSLKNGLRVWPVALATLMLVLMTIESIQYHASKLPYHHNYDSTESKPGSESQLENEDAVKSLLAFYTARFGDYHSRLHDMRDRTATGSSDLDMNPEDKFIENIREMIKKISLGEYAVRRAGAERVDQDMQWFFDRLVARLLVLDTK
ncbi:unnamed protein product [Periconia digitata]|uniref:Kinesin light chain n=1 Tax=Periconia digitata TaxID=1303443 RepID=A0A9W4UBW8_9PLEO|nr:unnamed protein product [Periconia digitata]